ncbi:MAG TPA: LysE family translocator, partial [Treponemataceae bacterium]|nr:LysE family translocator [Treponemataceae bacterium]
MSPSLFIAVLTFSLVSAFTPGPNNLLALASGANWGYRRTLPHVFGVAVGYAIMLALMGAGLGSLFKAAPIAQEILKWLAIAYLTFLAWKIATSTGIDDSSTSKESKPVLSRKTSFCSG